MEMKFLDFSASGQSLQNNTKQAFASNTVKYVGAIFNLDENWRGLDFVSAIWQGKTTIATVLDRDGYTMIPTEVLADVSPVMVNLVGSVVENNELKERLTTFPILALRVTADALITGSETAPVTPSQFEQFVSEVKADADRAEQAVEDVGEIKDEVAQLKEDTETLKEETAQIKTDVETIADGFDARVTEALGDISEAKTDALIDIGTAKDQVVDDITEEGTRQVGLVSAEGQTQTEAVQNEGETQVQNVTDEGTTQVGLVRTEGGTQITNIEQRGADVLSRIPYFAPIITDTAEGSIASFSDGADDYPMKSVVAEIVPIQEGSGDPSPDNVRPISGWDEVEVNSCGKNLLDLSSLVQGDWTSPSATNNCRITEYLPIKGGQTYMWSQTASVNGRYLRFYDADKEYISGISQYNKVNETFTTPDNACYFMAMWYKTTPIAPSDIEALMPQIELGSTATAYEPYQGESYSIPFKDSEDNPITVYGGEIDVVSGLLKSYPFYPSYNGETLSGEWICDRAVYSQGTTPPIGSQVVDMSGNGTEYQLEPTEIKTLKGNNNVWADTGDTSVEYPADTKLYIDKKIGTTTRTFATYTSPAVVPDTTESE